MAYTKTLEAFDAGRPCFPDVKRPRGHEKRQPLGLSGLIFVYLSGCQEGRGRAAVLFRESRRQDPGDGVSVLPVFAISRPVLLLPG